MAYGITEYPNQFKRQGAFSLDKTSKFATLLEAQDYAASSPIAYNLQIIGVDETNLLYVLVPSEIDDIQYNILPLDVLSSNHLKYEIGTWALTSRISNNNDTQISASFNFDIKYPIVATHYRIFINGNDISGQLNLGTEFVTAPVLFTQDGVDIYMTLERVDSKGITIELLKAKVVKVYNTSLVVMGILTTSEN